MEINNNYGSKPMTELGILQQELLIARTEMLKQQGITQELLRVLGNMKLKAIKGMYPSVKVFHEKYGDCSYEWELQRGIDYIRIYLNYYVENLPLDGLSKSDKVLARRYNNLYSYQSRDELSYKFKSLAERLTSYVFWDYNLNSITDVDFLTGGIHCDETNGSFTVKLCG